MNKKNESVPSISNGITTELIRQKSYDRTILVIYMDVPANHKVYLKSKEPLLQKTEEQRLLSEKVIREVVRMRTNDAPEREIRRMVKEKYSDRIKKTPEKKQKQGSVLNFTIDLKPGLDEQIQYFKYMLPGADHEVTINIDYGPEIKQEQVKLDRLTTFTNHKVNV